jgi:hypothetical protein
MSGINKCVTFYVREINVHVYIVYEREKERECVCTVRSESRCALRLRYVDLVVSIEVAVQVYSCFTVLVFSC